MAQSRTRSYKAKQICDAYDISKATLFRWERQGLISGVGRDWRNWRIYSDKNRREIERLIRGRGNRRER
ncbi:MAG: MerR family transcriptional regulator [Nitrospirota bacterium]